ncbi:2-dehydropantoate 2-reductase [Seongchinamella sediminis]|uniref:2-dehydropantoate 2-reductase n=2 Tax=Seongchinamella sediminis TaxID=2283635 RepID=A0A3L7E3M8_9GAMM|nr:2-dehydropantoate 2-reductase [Seongchinamella sediminis]
MGCLFAAALGEAGCRVSLLLRASRPQQQGAITVTTGAGSSSCPVILDSPAGSAAIGHLLVCTKAYDISDAVAGIAHRLDPATPVVLAANGLGYLEWFDTQLPGQPLYCCLSTEGAYRTGPLKVHHAGRGSNLIGSPAGLPAPAWLDDWTASTLDTRWEPRIRDAQWHKLAINCAINPLTAVNRCRNGELARDDRLRAQVTQLCDEISAVSRAAGFSRTAASIHREVATVIANTANNRSSMLQDVLAGRATEIAFITGYLLDTAERLGVAAPLNRRLLQELDRHER